MNVILGVMTDEKNKLSKNFINTVAFSGTLKQESSVINPTIVMEVANPTLFNYMYIPEFNRYYYIDDVVSVRNGLWRISGKVDVLNSFKSYIRSCPIIISNTEDVDSENYMVGEIWKTLVKTKTDVIDFPSGLNSTGEYILITSGG
jgi:hypothetical protein